MFPRSYFGSQDFGIRYFGIGAEQVGGWFPKSYYAKWYFGKRYFGSVPAPGMSLQDAGDGCFIVGDNILQAYFGEGIPSDAALDITEAADGCAIEGDNFRNIAMPIVEAGDSADIAGAGLPVTLGTIAATEAADGVAVTATGAVDAAIAALEAGDSCAIISLDTDGTWTKVPLGGGTWTKQ